MIKQKLKVFLLIFLFSITVLGLFILLNNKNYNLQNIFSVKDNNFDPNKYENIESYLKTINVDGIDLINQSFYIKNKIGSTEKIQLIDLKNIDYNKINKDLVLTDIHNAYLSKNIFSNGISGIEPVDPISISKNSKFFSDLMDEKNKIIKDWQIYKKILENKNNKSIDDIKKLAFMYDIEGNYDSKNKLCLENKSCNKDVLVEISGVIKDQEGKNIKNAKVYLLNDNNISTITDIDGKYNLSLKTNELSTLRLRVIKDGYSDSISNIYVVFESKEFTFNRDFVLAKPLTVKNFTKTDLLKGELEISGDISNYKINTKGIVDIKGNNVSPEKVTAYLFEYNRENIVGLDNYFHLDIFDNSGNYNGNTFVTYGMPYLILKDENGQELFISKQNPATIVDNIANIDDLLKENQNINGYKTLTKEDIEKMVSKNEFIYLSNYAKENKIIMPYKWNLNVKKGIWEESSVKFLDSKTAKAETIYYNID